MLTIHVQPIIQTQRSRNPAEYPVLGMLALGPTHGYDICRRLQEELGSIQRLKKSQVYALLARLEREGIVTHERLGQENLPAKNMFTLTPEGHEVFREWVSAPVRHMRAMRLEFVTKLWFAGKLGPTSEKILIEQQLNVCRENLRRLEISKNSCRTEIEARAVEFRIAAVKAAISWLAGLSTPIEGVAGQQ
jgi:DNA-binding PadR family transcriptional regulator